jgi:hypothetical protein
VYEVPSDSGASRIRPDGCHHFTNGDNFSDTVVSVVSHPCSPSYIEGLKTDKVPGAANAAAVKKKKKKYSKYAKDQGAELLCLAVETYGRFSKDWGMFFRNLVSEAVSSGICSPQLRFRAAYLKNLVQETSVALQTGNAKIALGWLRVVRAADVVARKSPLPVVGLASGISPHANSLVLRTTTNCLLSVMLQMCGQPTRFAFILALSLQVPLKCRSTIT